MQTQLVRVVTPDGFWLDGAYLLPSRLPVTAYLLLHGTGSNFYSPGVLETFARQAVDSGAAVLRANTRGHDGVASIPGTKQSVKGGATFERIADCQHDIAAWCEFLHNAGMQRVVLVGHSMGGVKAIYSQAVAPDSIVSAIVCLSPPRFCHEHWMRHAQADAFRSHWRVAQEHVAAGRSQALFECRQPTPFVATASGFLDKYGPEDRYDFVKHVPALKVPLRLLIGDETLASSPAFDELPQWVSELRSAGCDVKLSVLPECNMNYVPRPERAFEVASEEIGSLAGG